MILDGREIAEFVKERHFQQARNLRPPAKLAIINASSDPAVETYIKAKQRYADDIGAELIIVSPQPETQALIRAIDLLNRDESVHGIIVQLPLPEAVDTDQVLAAVEPTKDVDGLGPQSVFYPGTPTAVMWLLASHGIEIKNQTFVVVGQGRLVGGPLASMLEAAGARVIRCDEHTQDLAGQTIQGDAVVAATGVPGLIKPGMIKSGAAVIDASADIDPALRDDETISVTPKIGGLGPVTVAVLFEHLLAARL